MASPARFGHEPANHNGDYNCHLGESDLQLAALPPDQSVDGVRLSVFTERTHLSACNKIKADLHATSIERPLRIFARISNK
jgi:hypothetical protein